MTLEDNIVSTSRQYFEKLGFTEDKIDWDETGNPELISMKEYDMVEEIIALQVSFWCLRRLRNSCQSISDSLHSIIKRKIREYSETFNKEFNNFNAENIW